jgi:hypothetical protein
MTQDELLKRLHCIYASIDAATEIDMSKLPAKMFQGRDCIGFVQDFAGNLSEHDIENAAQTIIHNIASLQDNLARWAARNGKDKTKVATAFDKSFDLQIIKDLWNNYKHGHPPRNSGHSKRTPKLVSVGRHMKLTTQGKAGSFVVMTLDAAGAPKIGGDGSACAVITGDVVDGSGAKIGDLFEIEERAIQAWEALLLDYGVPSLRGPG